MSNLFSFISGTLFGAYISQNYNIPDIANLSRICINYMKSLEKEQEQNQKKNND